MLAVFSGVLLCVLGQSRLMAAGAARRVLSLVAMCKQHSEFLTAVKALECVFRACIGSHRICIKVDMKTIHIDTIKIVRFPTSLQENNLPRPQG